MSTQAPVKTFAEELADWTAERGEQGALAARMSALAGQLGIDRKILRESVARWKLGGNLPDAISLALLWKSEGWDAREMLESVLASARQKGADDV